MRAAADTDAEDLLKDIDPSEWQVPPQCIPIHANVTTYDWSRLYSATKFDVIMMDPPWQLATANPTRGVALGYSQLTDQHIQQLPIPKLQDQGLCFIWVINAKYKFALDLFKQWGYRCVQRYHHHSKSLTLVQTRRLVDEIVWVKLTVNRRLAKSHGYYLQHAKEVCLVGQRGGDGGALCYNRDMAFRKDVICSERRGQSQKPEEIYEMIENLVPNGAQKRLKVTDHHTRRPLLGNFRSQEQLAQLLGVGRQRGDRHGPPRGGPGGDQQPPAAQGRSVWTRWLTDDVLSRAYTSR